MTTALVFGATASSVLVLGAIADIRLRLPEWVLAGMLAFAAGALITAVSLELFEDSYHQGGLWRAAIGMIVGAVVFTAISAGPDRVGRCSGEPGAWSLDRGGHRGPWRCSRRSSCPTFPKRWSEARPCGSRADPQPSSRPLGGRRCPPDTGGRRRRGFAVRCRDHLAAPGVCRRGGARLVGRHRDAGGVRAGRSVGRGQDHRRPFDNIATGWLRRGLQWHCKVGLDTGMLTWSTVHRRTAAIRVFDAFLADKDVPGPHLAEDAAAVRRLMLEFLGQLRAKTVTRGSRVGQRLSPASVQHTAGDLESFYAFMADDNDAAAAALARPVWSRLGPEHAGFYRRGELGRKPRPRLEGQIIDAEAMSQIMAGLGLLGDPVEVGGFGGEQAMRITMLMALLGRRVSEICMLDPDPLLPLSANGPKPQEPGEDPGAQAPVAKLRYQQTKIDDAPDTVLVHAEVVAIIRAQQEWAARHFAEHGAPGKRPKYLFLAALKNRNGDRPYSSMTLRDLLTRLADRLDIRDEAGRLVDFNRTHRFRHTVATGLLNGGVPLHVVQRHLGHLTPTMTMTYAQTLESTAEAEFLRYRKITAEATDVDIDPRDLYDMLGLDRRSDRVLPNGWCLLPPRQVCTKGNACLTCDKFATDASFLPELQAQQDRTERLIEQRRAAFLARTGEQMGEDNIWLVGRRQEHDALGRVIVTLEQTRLADGTVQAVRGAGVAARTEAITEKRDGKR